MILRKPYAFLIKHFKLIHLILAVLTGYVIYRAYDIMAFFNNYILHDYTGTFYTGFSKEYITLTLFLTIILIIAGLFGILLLFINKKKPNKIYIISIVYFIIYIIFLNIVKNAMVSLETVVLAAQNARIYRDLSLISLLPLLIFCIIYLVRGLGFNIRKFNFEQDIKELEISTEDNEEIELTIKGDRFKLRRNIRRFFREFSYYVKENKFIFTVICLLIFGSLGYLLYKALPEIINEKHNQKESFVINGLSYSVEDSIITNLDYQGNIIIDDGYYVVSKIRIQNTSLSDVYLDYNIFRLELGDSYVYPTIDKSINFIDYAESEPNNIIKANSDKLYSIVFKINENDIKKNYIIKISNGFAFSKRIKIGKYHYVTITPIIINKVVKDQVVNIGEELKFSNSYLNDTALTISKMEVTDKYIYEYESCIKDNCLTYKDIINIDYSKNNRILLVLDYKYEIDSTAPFYNYSQTINGFIESFAKIIYIDNLKENVLTIKNVTPSKLKNQLVFEVSKKIEDNTTVYLSITIRNKEYRIKLK